MRTLIALLVLFSSATIHAADVDQLAAIDAIQTEDALLIDVRTDEEFSTGTLKGAQHVEYQDIAGKISQLQPDKTAPIVLFCKSGRRSGIAQDELIKLGYSNVINAGGYEELQSVLEASD
ncbi:rhodanese-like domain-containing protein [Pseudomonas segetis]|uniref:Phage shock protein E n=1 Tax=Pseudomonas segetis TaxID=298908 RepID=A0A239AA58_9PSED|nr:rhodanese-like domain-containing protein [Pseudomonas segetis]SNR92515.1 phage shock protein E [Pseudomonas segetis]